MAKMYLFCLFLQRLKSDQWARDTIRFVFIKFIIMYANITKIKF